MANNKDFKVKNGIQPTVYNEGVGTVVSGSNPWSISAISYDSKSFSLASQDSEPRQIFIKSDGTKLYLAGGTNTTIYQYSLSTAWDISTASYDSVSFGVSGQGASFLRGIDFKSDGTKMFVASGGNATVYQYSLSTAWDLSTASYDSVSFSTSSQVASLQNVVFKTDGTKLYANSYDGFGVAATVYQYALSTAWDLSTASYESKSLSGAINGVHSAFKPDGTKLYFGNFNEEIIEYSLSTAWDVSTGTATGNSGLVSGQLTSLTGFVFKPDDGTKLYAVGQDNDSVYQFSVEQTTASLDLSTGAVFDYTPTSDVQVTVSNPAASGTVSSATLLLGGGASVAYDIANAAYDSVSFSVSSQDTAPEGLSFNSTGTKLYVVGDGTDKLYEYDMSSASDISTAVYNNSFFDHSAQATAATGVTFNLTGTKMYLVSGGLSRFVYQYSLSAAFDITTASYDSVSLDVGSESTAPQDLRFNSDGSKLYVVQSNPSDAVFQYSLTTNFDLSTASYDSVSFSVASQDTTPTSLAFNGDGTKMFILGDANNTVYQYSLSTAFDLSTASYDSVNFSVASQDTTPKGLAFNLSGAKLCVIGSGTDTIYQYNTSTPATITYDTTLEWAGGTAPTSPAIGETDVITISTRDGGTTYQAIQAIDGAK